MPASRRRHLRPRALHARARVRAVQVWPSACPRPSGARPQRGWLQLQMHYDLAQIYQRVERIQVTPFGRPETELMPAGI